MTNQWQEDVQEFHEKFGLPVGREISLNDAELRAKLIMEEAVETVSAMGFTVSALIDEVGIPGERPHREIGRFHKSFTEGDIHEVADGLADLIYVACGAAVTFGIDLDEVYGEVHATNMAKTGGGTRGDGKILKPEGWQPPDIAGILEAQAARWLYRARETWHGRNH